MGRNILRVISLTGLFSLFIGGYWLSESSETQNRASRSAPAHEDVFERRSVKRNTPLRNLLRSGDVLLIEGNTRFSAIVRSRNPQASDISHIGIVDLRKNQILLIHAVPGSSGGVRTDPLGDLIRKGKGSGFENYRPSNPEIGKHAVRTALQQAEKDVGFDLFLDLKDPEQMYCSELVYYAYRQEGISFSNLETTTVQVGFRTKHVLFPQTFRKAKSMAFVDRVSYKKEK